MLLIPTRIFAPNAVRNSRSTRPSIRLHHCPLSPFNGWLVPFRFVILGGPRAFLRWFILPFVISPPPIVIPARQPDLGRSPEVLVLERVFEGSSVDLASPISLRFPLVETARKASLCGHPFPFHPRSAHPWSGITRRCGSIRPTTDRFIHPFCICSKILPVKPGNHVPISSVSAYNRHQITQGGFS